MFKTIEGTGANEVWTSAALLLNGEEAIQQVIHRGEEKFLTQEMLHVAMSISNPRQRWIPSRSPALNPAFAIAEVVWILAGRNDAHFLYYWNSELSRRLGIGPEYSGAYGYRLKVAFGIDQLKRAFLALNAEPSSRQVVLQLYHPALDMPGEDGTPSHNDIPCNTTALLKLRNGKLEWTQILRSNDAFLGMPHNFIQWTSVQEVMAGWLGVEVGGYHHYSDSLHVYEEHGEPVRSSVFVPARHNTDDLRLPFEKSQAVIENLYSRIHQLTNSKLTQSECVDLSASQDFPEAYANLLRIMLAERARRAKWLDLMEGTIAECSNGALTQAWELWLARLSTRNLVRRLED